MDHVELCVDYLELCVHSLELHVDSLEPRVDLLELARLHRVSASYCLGFERRCLHFRKLQIESRQNNLELRRDSLVTSEFKFEFVTFQTVARRLKTLITRYSMLEFQIGVHV